MDTIEYLSTLLSISEAFCCGILLGRKTETWDIDKGKHRIKKFSFNMRNKKLLLNTKRNKPLDIRQTEGDS